MKKIIFVVNTWLFLGLSCPFYADAITVTSKTTHGIQESQPVGKTVSENSVLLLSWQGNQLLTTKGTFVTDGIEIINKSGLDRDKIASQKNHPVVDLIKDGNTIIKIVISPNS